MFSAIEKRIERGMGKDAFNRAFADKIFRNFM